ncbi:aminotransferase class V-fold PLP-dependent enzyme [Chloroflexota bacterium]
MGHNLGLSGLGKNHAMKSRPSLTFKVASEKWEFEQAHRLNYRTFVEEIPQHGPNPSKVLVDKFHDENTYLICLRGRKLLGMATIRDKCPFSLDAKLENLDSYLPKKGSICEIRLLTVERNHRSGRIALGLVALLAQYFDSGGYDLAVISGAVTQLKLYKHIGFVPFGPIVGTQNAMYQPMYFPSEALKKLKERSKAFSRSFEESKKKSTIFFHSLTAPAVIRRNVNLLPGPVGVSQQVQQVFGEIPISHRSETFVEDFHLTKRLLCQLVGSKNVEILMGSGTLANDVIAAQLSLNSSQGLILGNGEFGNRLIDHATRLRLSFQTLQVDWGETFNYKDIKHIIAGNPEVKWLWAVHCETSTGFLNDMAMLKEVCAEREIWLCMDCVSSIGTVPVDLQGVYLASGVSGKGLGAFSGLSMVFYNHEILPVSKALPRYLDLCLYSAYNGIPFTISSNLLYALKIALERFQSSKLFTDIVELSVWIRYRLRELGFHILSPDAHASPAVTTLVFPRTLNSEIIGRRLEEMGYLLSYKSEYLLNRNWLQICLMGECSQDMIIPLLNALEKACQY